MKAAIFGLGCALLLPLSMTAEAVRLVTLDPGHFHASLVQKHMYPQVNPLVHVYAPGGPDLDAHLQRVAAFNQRAQDPTSWQERVYVGPDFLKRMVQEKAGNVVVISGNNSRKTEYIQRSVEAGFHVLADKPMAITPEGFRRLRQAFDRAARQRVLLWDMMTERHEVTIQVQRELARMPQLFGTLEPGSSEKPAVVMESVHYFLKQVDGRPLLRPAWFFDVRQEGEAIADVGTHLVDLVQWQCFPDVMLDPQRDIRITGARRWPTTVSPKQFERATGLNEFPRFLRRDIGPDGDLNVYQNGEVTYQVQGVHVRVTALWHCEPPPGAKDTHYASFSGTRANLVLRQGAEQQYRPTLYVEDKTGDTPPVFEARLRAAVDSFRSRWPGIDCKVQGREGIILIPNQFNVGHEAHFAQVTERFLTFLAQGSMPAWEVSNLLAKYYITTEAYRLSHRKRSAR